MGLPLALLVGWSLISEFKKYILSISSIRDFVSKLINKNMEKEYKSDYMPRMGLGILIFIISYILFIGSYKVTFPRHLIILYPTLIIFASVFLYTFNRRIVWICGCIVWVVSFIYTFAFASIMWTQTTGQEASIWISENIPVDIGIMHPPEVLFDWLSPELDRDMTQTESEWILITQVDTDVFLKYYENPHYFNEIDWFPLEDVNIDETLEFYRLIWKEDSKYQLVKTFNRKPSFLGIEFSDSGAPFPMNSLLHPEIRLYKRLE